MNLYEEFKVYENLWESTEQEDKEIIIKQGGQSYDIAKEDEFVKCINAFAEAKKATLAKSKTSKKVLSGEELAAYEAKQKVNIANSLLSQLKEKAADELIISRATEIVKELKDAYNKYPELIKQVTNRYV